METQRNGYFVPRSALLIEHKRIIRSHLT